MSQTETPAAPAALVLAESLRMRMPTSLNCIQPTIESLKTRALLCGACDEVQAARLLLVLHEALTNSVVHGNLEVSSRLKEEDHDLFARTLAERSADPAYAGRCVHIGFDYNGQRCQWALTDQGPGFAFQELLDRPEPSPEELWAISGRGIRLMQALMDEVRYEAGGRRVILTLERPNPEKRRHPRWPLHQRVQVAPVRSDGTVDWEAAYEAIAQDLSEGGLGLLQARLADVERVLIALDLDGKPLYLPAQVRHCQTVKNNMLELGCRFLLQDDFSPAVGPPAQNLEEAIDAMIVRLQCRPVVGDERRRHPRVSYTERIEVEALEGGEPLFACARDISRGGLAFIATQALPAGTRVLALPQGSGRPIRVRGHIVRCVSLAEGFYDVAVRFQELL